jgi:hypothetical protein
MPQGLFCTRELPPSNTLSNFFGSADQLAAVARRPKLRSIAGKGEPTARRC